MSALKANKDLMDDSGIQLSPVHQFRTKNGTISAVPVVLDFWKFITIAPNEMIVPGVNVRDLLHAVIGLYSVSLSEMTPDILYSYVCDKCAKTIVLIQDLEECVDIANSRQQATQERKAEENFSNNSNDIDDVSKQNVRKDDKDDAETTDDSIEIKDDVYVEDDNGPGIFEDVFSDEESEKETEEDETPEEEDPDFSVGINSFIRAVKERRAARSTAVQPVQSCDLGIENRIIGCVTFENKFVKLTKVVHLTLLSVRKRYRRCGVARFLLSKLMDPLVSGHSEAVVVHADNEAIPFFKRFYFTDDVVLNSRWMELAEQFTNCTIMSYLPSFSVPDVNPLEKDSKVDDSPALSELRKEFSRWRNKSVEAYEAQTSCMFRCQQEIVCLLKKVNYQRTMIDTLLQDNEHLMKEYKLLQDKLSSSESAFTKGRNLEVGDAAMNHETNDFTSTTNKTDINDNNAVQDVPLSLCPDSPFIM